MDFLKTTYNKILNWIAFKRMFKTDEATGERRFLPYGKWGQKFPIQPQQEEEIKRFLKRFYLITFPIALFCSFVLGSFVYILMVPIAIYYYYKVFSISENELTVRGKINPKAILLEVWNALDVKGLMVGSVFNAILLLLNICSLGLLSGWALAKALISIIYWSVILFFFVKQYLKKRAERKAEGNAKSGSIIKEMITEKIDSDIED